jgi:hypothetical protein
MNFTVVILCLIGAILTVSLFLSYMTGIGKTFKQTPASSLQSSTIKDQQHQSAQDTQRRQQELMDSIKQKISDNNHKF